MSSPTIEALRPSLGFRAACPGLRLMRLVLKFVAFASSWPLGHPDYRTQVRAGERLRKAVSARNKPEFRRRRQACPLFGPELQVAYPIWKILSHCVSN